MGALTSDLFKAATVYWLGLCEIALLAFGVLLVIGLIGEIKTAKESRWFKPFEWMVVIGVGGELVADGGIFLFSSHLETLTAIEVADAKERASKADERASKLEKEAALLRQLVQGRQLSSEQIGQIAASLKPFANRNVFISSYTGDAEAARLGLQIISALKGSGINVDDNLGRTTAARGGVSFGVHVVGSVGDEDFMEALVKVLSDGGIEAEGNVRVPKNSVTGILVALRRVPGTE